MRDRKTTQAELYYTQGRLDALLGLRAVLQDEQKRLIEQRDKLVAELARLNMDPA